MTLIEEAAPEITLDPGGKGSPLIFGLCLSSDRPIIAIFEVSRIKLAESNPLNLEKDGGHAESIDSGAILFSLLHNSVSGKSLWLSM
jgi:hypothetical protein